MRSYKSGLLVCAGALTALAALPPAGAVAEPVMDDAGQCTFPAKQIPGTPWPLQRILFDQLWQKTKGRGVKVAVIDSGVDSRNPQLRPAVDVADGKNYLDKTRPTSDQDGHGTKVAGIIAARPAAGTGFVGIAPESTIIPIKQNNEQGKGQIRTMAEAVTYAVAKGAQVINISQDATSPAPDELPQLQQAIDGALAKQVVVVAAAGNDGTNGRTATTYPAAFHGVLAVAASDRDNERASFSQAGTFVGVAAPGVDIVSDVPGGGQCVDNGTSFSTPYVSGVAALLRAEHPTWKANEIVAEIEQTAERSINGHDDFVGWGVVDPVRAVDDDSGPFESPSPDPGPPKPPAPQPARLTLSETPQERTSRYATYAVGIAAIVVAAIGGTAVVLRDTRRKRSGGTTQGPSAQG
jgi:membrane-anchored mycosin MYCP